MEACSRIEAVAPTFRKASVAAAPRVKPKMTDQLFFRLDSQIWGRALLHI
jgi:hypothetical protein